MRKINEKNGQGGGIDWEDFYPTPMKAFGVFECVNPMNSGESAFMKIHLQCMPAAHHFSLSYKINRNSDMKIPGYHMRVQSTLPLTRRLSKHCLGLKYLSK